VKLRVAALLGREGGRGTTTRSTASSWRSRDPCSRRFRLCVGEHQARAATPRARPARRPHRARRRAIRM